MRGRSSGKTAPLATHASPGKAGGLKYIYLMVSFYLSFQIFQRYSLEPSPSSHGTASVRNTLGQRPREQPSRRPQGETAMLKTDFGRR